MGVSGNLNSFAHMKRPVLFLSPWFGTWTGIVIFVLGLGSSRPVADDKTVAGRRQNRRVEVRIFTADDGGKNAQPSAAARL